MTSQKIRINVPPPLTAAHRRILANMAVPPPQSPYSYGSGGGGGNQSAQGAGQPVQETPNSREHERFCSFVERFVIERCRDWDQTRMDEEGWKCIQDAKMTYSMIQRVGRGYTQQPK